ncbi:MULTISPECIES: DUF389 domain-containing protein [unclassified Sphingosinithalassobacter]|uniref:DUF389 domain-containing protein n=1 Tax=unclassified Sphingosinithalassobacter TaxID=2676235 RepID=UPI00165D4268|nr:DUF389 domain-containing protein [Sphingosinithalassobacter sp. CS137]
MEASAGLSIRRNPLIDWWREHVVQSVDHVRVIDKLRGESSWGGRYAFMTLMSAGIAVLGLLLSSPAVVIGAMLISPLMGPIIGLGFGLATFDGVEIRTSSIALALGVVLAVLFSALVVALSPLQNVTEEIAARTRPNLFDLMVALFSALAGAYAMVRGREGTVVGVAIATALMPPLSVIGFGLATLNWTVFAGSTLLFFTNLMTIVGAAAIVARFYGFGAHLSPQHTMLQTVLVFGSFIALAIPLGFTLNQIAWEVTTSARARDVVLAQFEGGARISQIDVAFNVEPLRVEATVLTPEFSRDAEAGAAATLRQLVRRDVAVEIEQVQVGTAGQAEAEQIASAQASARQSAADQVAARVTEQLALIAGVDGSAVVTDRGNRRAVVNAQPLPGASLSAYRTLETRVAAAASDWSVTLVPPAAPLPPVPFGPEGPDSDGREAIATAAWGARRLNLPIGVAGADARVEAVVEALRDAGARAEPIDGAGTPAGAVRLRWLAPADIAAALP